MAHLTEYCSIEESLVERRHAIRYELQIPVTFSWDTAEGSRLQAEGMTRDISEVGVFIFAGDCPPPRSKVRIEIMLAQPGIASASLKGKMQVLRVEDDREKSTPCGFALAGKTFSLSSAPEG